MIAKQESVDYYYSNCNNPGPPPAVITAPMNFMDHGNEGNTFPSFYSLINANNSAAAGRRADEMLSGNGYRSFFLTKKKEKSINLKKKIGFSQVADGLSIQ